MLRFWSLVFPHYPLPITNYPLPITHYQLPITNYQLPITHYPLKPFATTPHNNDQLQRKKRTC
ncbi:hypothetical protein [Fischerella thermalis]|uniref:hypothetical protein n=1 Tax=Fischerella thermalis TaxID=372787 RepID=UPI00307D86FA